MIYHNKMNYQLYIDRLIEYAEELGGSVILDSPEVDSGALGHITFMHNEIHIASGSTYQIMNVLAHEIGHLIGRQRSIRDYKQYTLHNHIHLREIDAYKWGWYEIGRASCRERV